MRLATKKGVYIHDLRSQWPVAVVPTARRDCKGVPGGHLSRGQKKLAASSTSILWECVVAEDVQYTFSCTTPTVLPKNLIANLNLRPHFSHHDLLPADCLLPFLASWWHLQITEGPRMGVELLPAWEMGRQEE